MGCCCSHPAVLLDEPEHYPPPASIRTSNGNVKEAKEAPPLQEHPNKPLKLPKTWTSDKRSWTREQLDSAREEFFHISMAVNDPNAWLTINEVCKLLRDRDQEEDDIKPQEADSALEQAQAILTAAELTTPTGSLKTLFDAQGRKYEIPAHIISDPVNIVVENERGNTDPDMDDYSEMEETEKYLLRNQDKGKGPADTLPDSPTAGYTVRLRRADFPHDTIIESVCYTNTVAMIKERFVEEGQTARLFYRGRELQDSKRPVNDYSYVPGDVLTALVVSAS